MRVLMLCHQLPTPDNPGSMAPVARQIDSLRATGATVEVVELTGLPKLKYLQALPRLWTRLPACDLVHAHFGYCGWLARLQLTRPLVISFMGDDLLGTPNARSEITALSRALVRSNQWLAQLADAVIVKSAEMARVVPSLPAHVIPNGVDTRAFRPMDPQAARAALGWEEGRRYVLFPGDPRNPRKGYALALATISRASARARQQIELIPLWGVPPERVPLFMNACDAMLMTSLIEGSPNVVKEALACDLPVIGVSVGDVAEQISGVAGCALCPRDPAPLAAALLALARGQRCAGRAAIERRGLDLDSVARAVMRVYTEVLTRRRNTVDRRVSS